jgi:cystathionine beta-lyase/cystathionine gamma-synthase
MNVKEILTRLGEEDKSGQFGAVSPPIYQTSNFVFQSVDDYAKAMTDEQHIPIYTRGSNPTVRLLEKKLAALQGTEDALMFSSGSAALAASIVSLVKAGDHVICVSNVYSWTNKLLTQTLPRFGVETSFVDGRTLDAFKDACKPNTSLVIIESPTSLRFELQDIKEVIPWAKSCGYKVVVDNSYGSVFTNLPVELGADLVCHSATKFVGGHSDVVSGLACGNKETIAKLFNEEYMTFGACISPIEAWLLLRSLRTMSMRLKHTGESATVVSQFLYDHPAVEEIMDPFHSSHPQHDMALEQFALRIPMFSFGLKSRNVEQIKAFVDRLKVIQIGASWGGHESLIVPLIAFADPNKPVNIARLYVGFEDPQDLIADLTQALEVFE